LGLFVLFIHALPCLLTIPRNPLTSIPVSRLSFRALVLRDAAQHPLSFEEKKALIAKIHKLPPHKMEQVVEIISNSINVDPNQSEEMEVPLDELDTHTLRTLQKFVEVS
jgi:hypothetical protein